MKISKPFQMSHNQLHNNYVLNIVKYRTGIVIGGLLSHNNECQEGEEKLHFIFHSTVGIIHFEVIWH